MRKRRMKWNVLALCMAAILIVTMLPTGIDKGRDDKW